MTPKAKQKSKSKNGQFNKYVLYLFDPKKIAQKSKKKTALKIKTILPVAHSLDSAFNRDNSPCTFGTNVQIVSDSSRCDLQNLIGCLLQSKKNSNKYSKKSMTAGI